MRLLVILISLLAAASCVSKTQARETLKAAMTAPLHTAEDSAKVSRDVESALDGRALGGMRRLEVQALLGRGDRCGTHQLCAEKKFEQDDWYYIVGERQEGFSEQPPVMIVGFDREGRVQRVWNLRTH